MRNTSGENKAKFQFLNGSITSMLAVGDVNGGNAFQFLNGSIKRYTAKTCLSPYPYFNS